MYKYNAITGNLDLVEESGGGVGISSVLAQASLVSPTTTVTTDGTTATVENRAWETPYVVDTNTTPGLRGTFSTVQSALNQAVADGMTLSNPKVIQIRNCAIVENLTIPGGAFFQGAGYAGDDSNLIFPVSITGNHTLAALCEFGSNGIRWACSTGDLFTTGGSFTALLARNSIFNNPTGNIFEFNAGASHLDLEDCRFVGGASQTIQINISDFGTCSIKNCDFNGIGFGVGAGTLRLDNCTNIGQTDISSLIYAKNCSFITSGNDNITGSGAAQIFNCTFTNENGFRGIAVAGAITMQQCYLNPTVTMPQDLIDLSNTNIKYGFVQAGNVLKGVRTATDFTSTGYGENYIGVTDTSAPRTISLWRGVDSTIALQDYQVWVVDESGDASTNPIEIVDAQGALINGLPSYRISQSYGAALFHTDGANWWTIVPFPSPLNVSNGGLGTDNIPQNSLLIGNGINPVQSLSPVAAGKIVQSVGISSPPAYSTATWPITPGAIRNVVQTADGINFTSSAPITTNVVSGIITNGAPVALVSSVTKNITSISLTAGVWDISCLALFTGNPTVSLAGQAAGISTTTASVPNIGSQSATASWQTANFALNDCPIVVPRVVLTFSVTTTVYLCAFADFSAGALSVYGSIKAVQIG